MTTNNREFDKKLAKLQVESNYFATLCAVIIAIGLTSLASSVTSPIFYVHIVIGTAIIIIGIVLFKITRRQTNSKIDDLQDWS